MVEAVARTSAEGVDSMSVVLLAGGLTPSPLASAARTPALRLFPDGAHSVLAHWLDRLGSLASTEEPIEVRVVFDSARDADQPPILTGPMRVVFENESGKYRGPAGVARDVALPLPGEGTVLIAEANRWLLEDLGPLMATHEARRADVTVARQADGAPAGLYLTRRSALELIPSRGFLDMKEQWLTRTMEAGLNVFVHTFDGGGAAPLRTREDVLRLARTLADDRMGGRMDARAGASADAGDRVLGDAEPAPGTSWRVVSPLAEVDATATIAGSVVMPGARVEANAVLARAVAPPGAVVRAGARLVDAVAPGDHVVAARMGLGLEVER